MLPYPRSARVSVVAQRRSRAGFTLVEMMVTVAIVGILAAISIPSYMGYLYRSRTTEAVGFLADIKARQEAYKSEYYQYCDASFPRNDYWPAGVPTASPRPWGTPTSDVISWSTLGVKPPNPSVYFSYMVRAGAPGSKPSGNNGDHGYDGSDFWFVSSAVSDLDGDGQFFTIESYSARQSLYLSNAKGWE
jgi:prepilin-type N-terminal cleavage/methylation domain-containing protein